jgi:spore maturation protein CgeB
MFHDGDEGVFFSTPDELVDKVKWLAGDAAEARRIAAAGLERVHRDGHSVDGRAQEWLDVVTANLARRHATS